MTSHLNQRKLLCTAFANGQHAHNQEYVRGSADSVQCKVCHTAFANGQHAHNQEYVRGSADSVQCKVCHAQQSAISRLECLCWDRIPVQPEMGTRDCVEERNDADLEFAALDKLEGEDCSSLLSQSVTHGRHAAWSDASHILQTDNAFSRQHSHEPLFTLLSHLLLRFCCTK